MIEGAVMIPRRTFLKTAALGAAAYVSESHRILAGMAHNGYTHFTVHPFIERHPEAVFIMRTNVDLKTNREANREAGVDFARSVFVPSDESGLSLSRRIAIKPNITGGGGNTVESMGIITDPFFVEGVVDGMKPLGFTADRFSVREVNSKSWEGHVYMSMAQHAGIDFRAMNGRAKGVIKEKMSGWTQTDEILGDDDTVWREIPDGIVHRQLPYLWPINARDSLLLNISKFKTHSMGLTLSCKNLQGSVANGFQNFCGGFDRIGIMPPKNVNPEFRRLLDDSLKRHAAMGIPRWDGTECPMKEIISQEVWAARTLDNLSATDCGLHIVEGIYGHDGHFSSGPNPHGNENNPRGKAWDYMSNILIFGKDPFRVDIIGHWLGGHEPGNFGFFHIAKERGMSTVLNPSNIPVYLWNNGRADLNPLAYFERTPLKTNYLQKTKGNNPEPVWHMCDEHFDYSGVDDEKPPEYEKPGIDILTTVSPSREYPMVALEYRLAEDGPARIEVSNENNETCEVIVNALRDRGAWLASWSAGGYAAGRYRITFRTTGFSDEKVIDIV